MIEEAHERGRNYLSGIERRPPFPDQAARDGLSIFTETFPDQGQGAIETLRMLDTHGSPATTASNGASWFGNTLWQGRPAFRISLSSWRTRHEDVGRLADALVAAARS